MKLCDSSYLIAFLHPNPNPPMDRYGKPVTQFRERISTLIEELSAANDVIGIPTPALAETLVRSGPNRAQYMKILGDSWKFQLIPFDARAAIETAELVAAVKTKKEQWGNWAKIKFDIQIVATAKAEGVSVIYSDDKDIENYAKRFNIRVIRICDLPTPPSKEEAAIDATPIGAQAFLPLKPASTQELQSTLEVKPDGAPTVTEDQKGNQLEAHPSDPPTTQGSDAGRTVREAPDEGKTSS